MVFQARSTRDRLRLAAFLRATFIHLRGKPRGDTLYISRPDGQPSRGDGWGWFSLSVPGQVEDIGGVYIGAYTYVECPKDRDSDLGVWLEMYPKQASTPLVSIRFDPPDLTHESLAKALDAFSAEFSAKTKDLMSVQAAVTLDS